MIFTISIIMSVLLTVMLMFRHTANSVYLKKFTWKKQQLVAVLLGVLFLIAIVVLDLCFPEYEVLGCILCLVQLCVNSVYVSVLNIVGTNRFRQCVIDEIVRLNINITEDPIVIRRKLIESSEMSYSIKDIQLAIETIAKANADNSNH